MNIAYLANVRFPSERAHTVQITHMCRAFCMAGARVTLYVNNRNTVSGCDIASYYETNIPFSIKRISSGFFSPKILPSFYISECIFAVNFLLHANRREFDIIYSRHEWIIWFLCFFVSVKKLVWESHEAKLNSPARRLLKKGVKTVVISEGIFDEYTSYGIPKSQMIVAHDGIDESFFSTVETKQCARQRLGLGSEKKLVMYIGGFDIWKGVETFFRSAEKLPEVCFVAIGGSKEEVCELKKDYPKVLFLGNMPYSMLKNNQQAADVLVVPNSSKNALSALYTSPLKLFAHMASGVPLIVSDIPSLTVVTGRDLVTVAQPDSVDSLVQAVLEVVGSIENKQKKAQELVRVSVRYTWDNRARAIIDFISST